MEDKKKKKKPQDYKQNRELLEKIRRMRDERNTYEPPL